MLRLLKTAIALALLMAVAALAAWIADQPGRARIAWFDHIVEAPAPLRRWASCCWSRRPSS